MSFNMSWDDGIDAGGVFGRRCGAETSSCVGVDRVVGTVSPEGWPLFMNGHVTFRAEIFVVAVVVQLFAVLWEKALSRDPSDDEVLWLPVTMSCGDPVGYASVPMMNVLGGSEGKFCVSYDFGGGFDDVMLFGGCFEVELAGIFVVFLFVSLVSRPFLAGSPRFLPSVGNQEDRNNYAEEVLAGSV